MTWAQTVPFVREKSDFGGTTVSSLTTFRPSGTAYTLELTGCVANQEITVPGGSFNYTPTADGTVRFVRNGASVHVYENGTYKATIEASAPQDPTYPDIFAGTDNSTDKTGIYSDSNLFKNPGFETVGDKISDNNYKGVDWESNGYSYKDAASRVRTNANLSGQEGSNTFLLHGYGNPAEYLSQALTGLQNYTPYKVKMRIWFHQESSCTYTAAIGTSIGNGAVYSGEVSTPGSGSADREFTFTTDALSAANYYFTLTRKTSNRLGNFDRMTMVAATGGGIGITGATGATYLPGTAYAPEGNLATASKDNPIDATSVVTNPTFDTNLTGWNSPIGGGSEIKVANNRTDQTTNFYQTWNSTPKQGRMYQQITDLPKGTYELKVFAFADQAGTMTPISTDVAVYAQGQDVGNTSSEHIHRNYVNSADFTYYKTYAYVDDAGKLEIGMRQDVTTFRWLGMDNVTLSYLGADNQEDALLLAELQEKWGTVKAVYEATSKDDNYANVVGSEKTALNEALAATVSAIADYATNAAALGVANAAFIAAKANYDLLANEVVKAKALGLDGATVDALAASASTTAATALTNTQALKVKEYEYVTDTYKYGVALSDTWNSTGTNTKAATFSNEHWSGTTHDYKNQDDNNGQGYNAANWTLDFNQDILLPAGNFVFKVAGRQASGGNTTMALVVKAGETVLGTVSDFPQSNNALGINKAGATSFDPDDEAGFARNGNGYGWEWRYVQFTLSETATVNVGIHAEGRATHQWISFGDYTLQTDNEASMALISYNVALSAAKTAQGSTDYTNVTGSEKTALDNAIAGDDTLDKTSKAAVEAATATLNEATTAFTAAKDAYDAFVDAKGATYTDNLPYASATKSAAIATAQAATATSASEATTKTDAILSAYRKYVESNALAEGVDGVERVAITDADMDVTYDGEAHTFGAWQVIGQTNGKIQLLSSESFTDGDGKADYHYADIHKEDNNAGIQQAVNLQPGRYLLTVTARANTTAGASFRLFAGDKSMEMSRIGNTGGVFGRGWNDFSLEFDVNEAGAVNIGVQSGNGKDLWWSATRFRLMKLGNIASLAVKTKKYGTFMAPFDVEVPADVTAYTVTGVADNLLTLAAVAGTTIPANTPVVLYNDGEADVKSTVAGQNATHNDSYQVGLLTGVYTAAIIPASTDAAKNYVLQTQDDKQAFYLVESDFTATPNRAYLTVASAGEVKAFYLDEADGLTRIVTTAAADDAVYNLAGQRVQKPVRGLYIIGGRKVVVK